MGKFVDLVLAILVLVIGLYVLTKLGITWSGIWKMVHAFFSSSPASNGTTSSILIGMAASNSKVRNKIKERKELLTRLAKIREIKGLIGRGVKRRA